MQYACTIMEPFRNVRILLAQWELIVEIARQERRSATAQLELVIDRGLGGRAGYELARLSAERSDKLMAGIKRS